MPHSQVVNKYGMASLTIVACRHWSRGGGRGRRRLWRSWCTRWSLCLVHPTSRHSTYAEESRACPLRLPIYWAAPPLDILPEMAPLARQNDHLILNFPCGLGQFRFGRFPYSCFSPLLALCIWRSCKWERRIWLLSSQVAHLLNVICEDTEIAEIQLKVGPPSFTPLQINTSA